MQIDLNVNFSPVQTQLDRIEALLNTLLEVQHQQGALLMTVSAETQQLLDEVTDLTTTEASVETLLQGLAAQVEAVAGDKDATLTVVTELKTLGDRMHAAVVANTPVDPTAPPAPAPAPAAVIDPPAA